MIGPEDTRVVRLERVLRLLPDVDALTDLRESLIRVSRTRPFAEPDGTVGKRQIHAADLGRLLPDAVTQATQHAARLYEAAVAALDRLQRGDQSAAVRALLEGGELEERLGRPSQAYSWYQHALEAARPLRERRPEIEVLCHLGGLQVRRDRWDDAARCYQRSLALAEAESDSPGAAEACRQLGGVASAQARWQGAESWYTRGLRHAAEDRGSRANLTLGLAQVARQRGELEAAAHRVREAREAFEALADPLGLAQVLNESARLERLRGHLLEAATLHQEALARLRTAEADPRLEISIRLDLSRLYLDWGRLHDAEDESRRAEERAIAGNLQRELVQAYLMLGNVRAKRADEGGFIFFENAIDLCRGREPLPRLEAEAYLEYGIFRDGLGDHDEARAYLLRAREILEGLGDDPLLPRVGTKLAQMGAA